ncbi:hypothetical protein [Paludisphaera mucosa]|uniref:Uncharacterized protein n=1 Tax=Paludisphaera mucosa TaxID=3030827 RepID=A0ABT6FF40_9BACT|nr:hypothetical protein [Paludisphaera mucosa]MDG3006116.1 hypothetical protein [Paludisphaera mucosa]
MGIATGKWERHECRSENGILYATGLFVPLVGSPEFGYQSGPPETLSSLLSRRAGEWIEVDTLCRSLEPGSGVVVEAGGGFFEGEGFVAVAGPPGGGLIWVLHLSNSEAFTAVAVDGSEIVAVAEEYPSRNEFRIPLREPHLLYVRSTRHL